MECKQVKGFNDLIYIGRPECKHSFCKKCMVKYVGGVFDRIEKGNFEYVTCPMNRKGEACCNGQEVTKKALLEIVEGNEYLSRDVEPFYERKKKLFQQALESEKAAR